MLFPRGSKHQIDIMKYISIRILIICILLPPVFYNLSAYLLETYLKGRYAKEIMETVASDADALLNGSIRLKDSVNNNITTYLNAQKVLSWGVQIKVIVGTKKGTVLYPPIFYSGEDSLSQRDPMQIAAENYRMMNEGIIINVNLELANNTPITDVLLVFPVFVSIFLLYMGYRSGSRKAADEELKKRNEISRLLALEKDYTDKLNTLGKQREKIQRGIERVKNELKDEKVKASRNEEDMIDEIDTLEKEINMNLSLQNEQQSEIDELKETIADYKNQKGKKQKSRSPVVQKRFKVLYKNVSFQEKAISGFIDLPGDMKIKCEEVIHQLNEDSKLVQIKRKVFGKKGGLTVFEVALAYKGRLYFRKISANRIDILVIGTKNTQVKDLEVINNL